MNTNNILIKNENSGIDIFDPNLKNQIKGTGITLVGSLVGSILALFGTIIIARNYTVDDYGLFRLNVAIISSLIYITALGLADGTPVLISRFRGQGRLDCVKGTIYSSFFIVLLNSVFVSFLLFILSDFLAKRVFNIEELSLTLKIMSVGLPFWMLLSLMVAIYRGFESTKENVLFCEPMFRLLRLPLFALVIFLGLSFKYIFFSYVAAIIIVFLAAIPYYSKNLHNILKNINSRAKTGKSLLSFSLPLVISYLGWFMIKFSDKWLIGILKSEFEVGIYSSSTTFIEYLNFFLVALIFIYQPTASRLLGENSFAQLKSYYMLLTKWLYIITLPLVSVFIIYPELVINLIFGEKYILAAPILQILSIGSLFHILAGPNQQTLIALGKTKLIMYFTLPCGIINIIFNIFLIPKYGILVTAIINSGTYILVNLFNSFFIYKIKKIVPINKNVVLPILLSIFFMVLCYCFKVTYLTNLSPVIQFLICFIPFFVFILTIHITKSWDKEDYQLLLIIVKKIGFNLHKARV